MDMLQDMRDEIWKIDDIGIRARLFRLCADIEEAERTHNKAIITVLKEVQGNDLRICKGQHERTGTAW